MNKQDLIRKIKAIDDLTNEEKSELIELINTQKRYGLVWEEKPEEVEEELREKLPVLVEVKERAILGSGGQGFGSGEEDSILFTNPQPPSPNPQPPAPNHILIEGDNLHALTVLNYTHAGKIDVIYIDPPYNTGNKDFKYNDRFVDKEDAYRHSKWISFMYKRLKLAHKLLSTHGVIVISIGYHEVNNLILICEELFTGFQVVCITIQTSGGKPSSGFNYLQEYLIFITPEDFNPNPLTFTGGVNRSPFEGLTLSTFDQTQRPNQVYPIFIDNKTGCIVGYGSSLATRVKEGIYNSDIRDFKFDFNEAPKGTSALWPITSKGKECVWRLIPTRLMKDWQDGYIKISTNSSDKNPNKFSVQYLPEGVINKIKNGELEVIGTEDGRPTLYFGENRTVGSEIPTIWLEKSFFTNKGSSLLKDILGKSKFSYPKSVELIFEVLKGTSNLSSTILDFFSGSGTTLHATMQLNAEDGGNRQCILVTNNENKIAEEVCYERNKRVIEGYAFKGIKKYLLFSQKINYKLFKNNKKILEKITEIITRNNSNYDAVKVNLKNDELIVYGELGKKKKVYGLRNNNLRYFKTDFVGREKTNKNRKMLTELAADMLCIKEDCYESITDNKIRMTKGKIKLFSNENIYLMVILDEDSIKQAVEIIKDLDKIVKVFIFAPGQYPFTDDFEEVIEKVELCALPDAIYKAYKAILPNKKTIEYGKESSLEVCNEI